MTTDQNMKEQFTQALRDDPEWRNEIRRLLLGPDSAKDGKPQQAADHTPANTEERIALEQAVRRYAMVIAHSQGIRHPRELKTKDLIKKMTHSAPDSEQSSLPRYPALMIEGEDNWGKSMCIVVEAAPSANREDAEKTLGNARRVKSITGYITIPALASVQNSPGAQEMIDKGKIRWLPFSPGNYKFLTH